jgi:hypothetical protein
MEVFRAIYRGKEMSLEQLEKELQYLKAGEARVNKGKKAVMIQFSEGILKRKDIQEILDYRDKKYKNHPSSDSGKGNTGQSSCNLHYDNSKWLLPFSLSLIIFAMFWLIVAGTVYLAHNPIVITQVVEHNTTHEITTPTIIKETNNITNQVTKVQTLDLTQVGNMICIEDPKNLGEIHCRRD